MAFFVDNIIILSLQEEIGPRDYRAGATKTKLSLDFSKSKFLGSRLRSFQRWAEKWVGFTPVLFFGRGVFQYNYGVIPHRKPITVVVGKPINVDKVENPTAEQIQELHSKYVEGLKSLYQEYNPKYGDVNVKLVVE